MIGTSDEIKELLKNERRDRSNWSALLESRLLLPIFMSPGCDCTDSIGYLFE
jgi:hypothetical protein